MEYKEDDYLQLSGIQHFKFCRRQWALIHIENQWAENYRTTDGLIMHKKAHGDDKSESRGDMYITRGMRVFSSALGVSGTCDIVEFHKSSTGISIRNKDGLWQAYPVEYKRGRPKIHTADALQLCGQAMCLEEMLSCKIPEGALYYGEIRHRQTIEFNRNLRDEVKCLLTEMHDLYRRFYTPKVKPSKSCNACSLKEICLPVLMRQKTVKEYLEKSMEAE